MKKFISIILAILMVVSMLPITISAVDDVAAPTISLTGATAKSRGNGKSQYIYGK